MKDNLVYVIHRFGGDPEMLCSAESWAAWLTLRFGSVFIVPWVPMCRHWPDSGETRRLGLALDLKVVSVCRTAIAVRGGNSVSSGGKVEFAKAESLLLDPIDFSHIDSPDQIDEFSVAILGRRFGLR